MADGVRLAAKDDIPYLRDIWKASFPDSEEYVKLFYERNFDRIEIPVYCLNSKPVSMLHLFDAQFSDIDGCRKAKYAYAGATLTRYRKNGYYKALFFYAMDEAVKNGYLIFCKPFSPELSKYYEKLGFEIDSYFRLVTLNPHKPLPLSVSDISPEQYKSMRDSAFSHIPYAKWSDSHIRWCVEENAYFSGRTLAFEYSGEEHFLMCYPVNDTLIITETDLSLDALKSLSGSFCRLFGANELKAYMPETCPEGEKIISSIVYNGPLNKTYSNMILI